MHSYSHSIILMERWTARHRWGLAGPRSFRAFIAPVAGWLLAQIEEANASRRAEVAAENWAAAKLARDDYAARNGGYNASGFAIPGAVAAAVRGER